MTISDLLANAAADLAEAGVADPIREARLLLLHVLKRDTTFTIAHPEYTLTKAEAELFTLIVERRRRREPLQYIRGTQEFYGLEFNVEAGVLIPRPETETLVEEAVTRLSGYNDSRFLELGVGSGCISVAILHSVRSSSGVGVDISETALRIAAKNAARHSVDRRLTLQKGDLFAGVSTVFDLIVSNPPYIPDRERETLQPEVGLYEPKTALFAGEDGLDVVRRIINDAPRFLRPEGWILIEIGFGQSASVKEMFDRRVWNEVEFVPDLQGIERVVRSCLR